MISDLHVSERELNIIQNILKKHVPQCKVLAFGSRVTGKMKIHSDLDLSLLHEDSLDQMILAKLRMAFEESDLPYKVDIVEYESVSPEFQKIIDRTSVAI